jgi:putative ATP-dependent endonuclease of the OLD family
MKIQKLEIKRYKSLLNLKLDDIGNLTIFIGKNSSGKSNIVEALNLFFNAFDSSIEKEIAPINDSIWYDRIIDKDKPIEFSLTIQLNDEEKEKILSNQNIKDLGFKNEGNNLTIDSQIVYIQPNKGLWKITSIKLDDFLLIQDGKLEKKSIEKTIKLPKQTPEPSVTPADQQTDDTKLQNVIQFISGMIKGKFSLIPSIRDAFGEPSTAGERISPIPPDIQSNIIKLQQSLVRSDTKKWSQIKEFLKSIQSTASELEILQNQIFVPEEDNRFPISSIGGGDQEVLKLIYLLIVEDRIFGIEEPELHLHPELERKFFDILKIISETKQLFITTHSPIFVDKSDLGNTWIVRKRNIESKVDRLKEEADLKKILYELGHKPSDIFFADKILLVEGYTEKVVLPILAKEIGINLLKYGVSIFPTRGKNQGKYHLKMWVQITKNADVPIFMLLDKNAETELNDIVRQKLIKQNLTHLWKKGNLEEYYPVEIFKDVSIEVIEKDFGIQLGEDDKEKIKKQTNLKTIEEILKKSEKPYDGWKVLIGRKVAEKMTVKDIDEEIRRVMERISRDFLKEESQV